MTSAQRRALEAVRDGRVFWSARQWRYIGARQSTVDALVRRGWVQRVPQAGRIRLVLTDAGREALDR